MQQETEGGIMSSAVDCMQELKESRHKGTIILSTQLLTVLRTRGGFFKPAQSVEKSAQ